MKDRLIDTTTAILLSIAAVGTAWTSYEASNWSGLVLDSQSRSAIYRADSSRAAAEASSQTSIDSIMWVSWVQATNRGDEPEAEFLRERFSTALDAAQEKWLGKIPTDEDGNPDYVPTTGTPLDLPGYIVPAQVEANAAAGRAEVELAKADEASAVSTKYVMLAVLFALVLFFASIATKFQSLRIQVSLTLVAVVVLAVTVGRMLMLPVL